MEEPTYRYGNGQDTKGKGKGKGKGTGEHTDTVQQQQLTWMSEPLLCHGTGTCPYCCIPYTDWWIYFVDTDDPEDVQPRPLRPEEEVALFMFRHTDDFICWRLEYPLGERQTWMWIEGYGRIEVETWDLSSGTWQVVRTGPLDRLCVSG